MSKRQRSARSGAQQKRHRGVELGWRREGQVVHTSEKDHLRFASVAQARRYMRTGER